uniref:Syntaxin binding protein 6 (amisyn), like n=1 Tax=Echeneis naucrates TaxID=173247 RepID=A0A665WJ00_ECHNA
MNVHSTINKEVFVPHDERMLVAVEVWRRKRKRMSFLPAGPKGNYATFICLSDASTVNLVIYRCKAFLNRIKNVMVAKQRRTPGNQSMHRKYRSLQVFQKMNMALGERGERLTRAEDKTIELMHTAQQFADTAHKLFNKQIYVFNITLKQLYNFP